jgi:hypothetical protein
VKHSSIELEAVERRLKARLKPAELGAIVFGILLSVGFVYIRATQDFHPTDGIDIGTFLNSVSGEYKDFYYPNWTIILFIPLTWLPPAIAYILWNTLNILGVWFACRVFGGKTAIALLSYQMLFSLYFGQIVGVIVAGIAFYWWMLQRERPLVAGWGAVLALIKPQMGIPMLLAMGLLGTDKWRDRIISAVIPFAVLGLSLLIWRGWIPDLLARMESNPPQMSGSIDLWQWIGAWTLILWLPVVFLPMPPVKRLIAVAATMSIATPYFIHNGLLALFMLPIGYIGLLGNIGYLMAFHGWWGVKLIAIAPLVAYVWVIGQAVRDLVHSRNVQSAANR